MDFGGCIKVTLFLGYGCIGRYRHVLFFISVIHQYSAYQKSLFHDRDFYALHFTFTVHLIGNIYQHARLDLVQAGFFAFFSNIISKNPPIFSAFQKCLVLRVYERGNHHPLSRLRREVNTMNKPARTQWQIRCAFTAILLGLLFPGKPCR